METQEKAPPHDAASSSNEKGHAGDVDVQRLAEMGYGQDMARKFTVWSVLGVGFSLSNTWWAVSTALVTGINSGGSVLLFYGSIILFLVSIGIAVSLSELISAMPNAGGQYYWTAQLAPKRYANGLSYITGWFAYAGSVFASSSASLSVAAAIVGCYQLTHPEFVIQSWHIFLTYQIVNAFTALFNTYGRILPFITTASLFTTLLSFLIILIVVPAKAPTHQHARFVFATFINNTGWSSNGIAYIVGLVNVNWGFSCLDTAVHLAEEIHAPERMIPVAICGTVIIGFVTSLSFIISMMFSLANFEAVADTATFVPILELFYQALGTRAGAAVLGAMIVATGVGCQIACHTWQSRLCWSFARDAGLPMKGFLSKVHPTLDVPLNAHLLSCVLDAVVGCLYLGSSTAFASIVSACIVLPYISYCFPVMCLLAKRRNIRPGPFWLGRLGAVSNVVLVCWTVFTAVMFSFPSSMPVVPSSMNYISAVYGITILFIGCDWILRGRKHFKGPTITIEGMATFP